MDFNGFCAIDSQETYAEVTRHTQVKRRKANSMTRLQ